MNRLSPPSRALTFLFLGLVLLLGALWGSRPLVHDDLFFHLATGRYVVETLQVPTVDLFSFTRAGEPWVSHEWGFGVLMHLFWFASGYWSLVGVKAGLTVAILLALLALMAWRCGRDVGAPTAGLVALLAVGLWAINDQLILRASLFSSLFILILMGLLLWFDETGSRLSFAAISGLFLLWSNFHGEVLFGLFLLGLTTVEALLSRWPAPAKLVPSSLLQAGPQRPYLLLFVVSLLLSLVNPNGIQVLFYPFRLAWFLFSRGGSLQMGHFGGATPGTSAGFYLLIAILLLGLLPIERFKVLSLTEVGTVVAFLVLSIRSHRFILYFVLFSLPVIVHLWSSGGSLDLSWLRRTRTRAVLVGFVMLVVAVTTATTWIEQPRTPLSRHFPRGAVRYLQQDEVSARMFNHQNYGGYLHWNLGQPVFWDGRNLLFASLMEEVSTMPLTEVETKWQINSLLLTEFEYLQMKSQIDPARWALVFWDDHSALYLRRESAFDSLLKQGELRRLPPFGGVEGLNLLAEAPAVRSETRRELDRILIFEPDCQRALYLHGLLSFYAGDYARAEEELRRASALGPNPFVEKALARVMERGRRL